MLAELHAKMKPDDFGELLKLLNKISGSKLVSMSIETGHVTETICVKTTPDISNI